MEESCSLSRIIPHPILHSWWSYGGRNCSLFPSRAVFSYGSEETKIGCQRRLMHLKDQKVHLTLQTNHKVQKKWASINIAKQKDDLISVKSKNRTLWTEWTSSGQCLSTGIKDISLSQLCTCDQQRTKFNDYYYFSFLKNKQITYYYCNNTILLSNRKQVTIIIIHYYYNNNNNNIIIIIIILLFKLSKNNK